MVVHNGVVIRNSSCRLACLFKLHTLSLIFEKLFIVNWHWITDVRRMHYGNNRVTFTFAAIFFSQLLFDACHAVSCWVTQRWSAKLNDYTVTDNMPFAGICWFRSGWINRCVLQSIYVVQSTSCFIQPLRIQQTPAIATLLITTFETLLRLFYGVTRHDKVWQGGARPSAQQTLLCVSDIVDQKTKNPLIPTCFVLYADQQNRERKWHVVMLKQKKKGVVCAGSITHRRSDN